MIRILVVDMWTKGLPHVEPLLSVFQEGEASVVLCHYGSLEGEETPEMETEQSGITIRDHRWYGPGGFRSVLEQEQPDLVLKLTFYYPYDAAHFKACRLLEVPTLYMAHGAMGFSDLGNHKTPRHRLSWRTPAVTLRKARKWVHHFAMVWSGERAWAASSGGPNRALGTILRSLGRGRHHWFNSPKSPDELPDYAAVYSPDDARRIVEAGFPPSACHVVGYPQLDRTFRTASDSARCDAIRSYLGPPGAQILVYYTSDLPSRTSVSRAAYEDYVRRLIRIVAESGVHLVIKVHPVEDASFYQSVAHDGARVVQDEMDTFECLAVADAVIGEVTTLVPMAHFIGKPVGYLDVFNVEFDAFDALADQFGIAVRDWDALRLMLSNLGGWGRRPSAAESLAAIGPHDGCAARRVKDVIVRAAGGHAPS